MENRIKKHSGFSLTELVMVMGIGTIISLGVMELFNRYKIAEKGFSEKADIVRSESMMKRLIFQDLVKSFPSMNFLSQKATDAKEACPLDNFWFISRNMEHSNCSLIFNLDPEDAPEFWIIRKTSQVGIMSTPATFYDVSGNSLSYSATKLKKELENNNIMNQGGVLFVSSPMPQVSYTKDFTGFALRYAHLLGVNGGSNFPFLNNRASFPEVVEPQNEECPVGYVIDSTDKFLRCLPRQGDSATVSIVPVKFIRYRIEPSKSYVGLYDLYRGTARITENELKFSEFKIADTIKSLAFSRDDITNPTINFSVVMENVRNLVKKSPTSTSP